MCWLVCGQKVYLGQVNIDMLKFELEDRSSWDQELVLRPSSHRRRKEKQPLAERLVTSAAAAQCFEDGESLSVCGRLAAGDWTLRQTGKWMSSALFLFISCWTYQHHLHSTDPQGKKLVYTRAERHSEVKLRLRDFSATRWSHTHQPLRVEVQLIPEGLYSKYMISI